MDGKATKRDRKGTDFDAKSSQNESKRCRKRRKSADPSAFQNHHRGEVYLPLTPLLPWGLSPRCLQKSDPFGLNLPKV